MYLAYHRNPKDLISQRELSTFQTTFVPGFAIYTYSYSFNPDIPLHVHSAECTVRWLYQAGSNNYGTPLNIRTTLNLWQTPGIEPASRDCGLTSVYKPAALPSESFRHPDRVMCQQVNKLLELSNETHVSSILSIFVSYHETRDMVFSIV